MRYETPTMAELGAAIELVQSDGNGGKTASGGDSQSSSLFCNIAEVDD
jgi:hypothetical protein